MGVLKRCFGIVFLVVLLFISLGAQAGANLLSNPGFENVTANGLPADGWWTWPGDGKIIDPKVGRIFVDTSTAHTGKNSAKFEIKALGSADLVSPTVKVNPGDTLYFSVYYRSNLKPALPDEEAIANKAKNAHRGEETPVVKANFGYRNDMGHAYEQVSLPAKPVTNGWEKLEGTFIAPVGALLAETGLYVYNYAGQVWWDDVVIKKLNTYSLNLAPYEEKKAPGKNQLDFILENYTAGKDPLKLELFFKGQTVGSSTITPGGSPKENFSIGYELKEPGTAPLKVVLTDQQGKLLFEVQKTLTVAEPLATGIILPRYLWPDKKIGKVTEKIDVSLSGEQLKDARLAIATVGEDNKQVKEIEIFPVQASTVYELPVSGLAPGKYRMIIRLLGKDGKSEISRKEEPFEVMGYPRPKVEVKAGQLLVAGKPFFPIGMFSPSTLYYQEYAAAGFNFAHNYSFDGDDKGGSLGTDRGCLEVMDQARAAGLWFVVSSPAFTMTRQDWDGLRSRFSSFKDHPSVLCYEEEEQMIGMGLPLEAARKWRELLRELDPDRPVLFGDICKPGPDGKRYFPFDIMDMAVMWWYPFPLTPGQTEIGIPEWMTDNIPLTDKPIWVAPQSWKNPMIPDGRWPLPEEYRVQAYLAIIHGAKGLMYFGGHIFGDPKAGHWEDLKKVVSELRDLSPVFLAPTAKAKIEKSAGDKVSTLLKEYQGKYYLLAANRDVPEASVTFTLPFKPRRINVQYENRRVATQGKSFQDTFGKYAVHVYEIVR